MGKITGSPDEPRPLSFLSNELSDYIGRLGHVWISAEITEWNERRGAIYGTFEDGDYTFPFTIWSNGSCSLPDQPLSVGDQVVALVTPRLWAKRGRMALNVKAIKLAGLGQLIAQVEALRLTLRAEGLFDEARKRPWPSLPARVGLVVGQDTMAEHDVINNAVALWPHVRFRVVNAPMQGPDCPAGVIEALQALEADPLVEVIIIARGGGDYRDLVGFSDEGLVRYVSAMTTPVISAIGHEPDRPILDDVADYRASTPTGAGKIVVMDTVSEQELLVSQRQAIARAMTDRLRREGEMLTHLRARILSPDAQITLLGQEIGRLHDRLYQTGLRLIDTERATLARVHATLLALSPHQVLQRGYVLAKVDDTVITTAKDAPIGTTMTLCFGDGELTAAVLGQHLHPSPIPSEQKETQ